jgi:hypothetical protein
MRSSATEINGAGSWDSMVDTVEASKYYPASISQGLLFKEKVEAKGSTTIQRRKYTLLISFGNNKRTNDCSGPHFA